MRVRAARGRLVGLALLLVSAGCTTGGDSAAELPLEGERLEVLATWSDTEQARFGRVLQEFELRTGARATYTSARHEMSTTLGERLAAGDPPDVAFLPQPGLLAQLAAEDRLVPLAPGTVERASTHFPPAFLRLASHEDQLYGVWFKAANKSLVWYDVAAFERVGVVPPRDLEGLLLLADRLAQEGIAAFSLATQDTWTLTDWFENLYLRLAGPEAYDDLAAHRIPWTDSTVVGTLQTMSRLLAPGHLPVGAADPATPRSTFEESVERVFGPQPAAAMVMEGDFVAGVITGSTEAVLGVHADVFPFPVGPDGAPAVVGGGDVAVMMRPSRAGAALLDFLTTPDAAAAWAGFGGFVSPNLDLDLSTYPDDLSRAIARRLLEAGNDFRFDLSDLQPAAFTGTSEAGFGAELRDYLVHRDVERVVTRLEAAADAAYGGAS